MGELTEEDRAMMRVVREYLARVNELAVNEGQARRSPLGDLISDHLQTDAALIPVVQETLAEHRLVDADIALDAVAAEADGRLVGVTGGEQKLHLGLAELVQHPHVAVGIGPVDYSERATGPTSTRRVVSFGVRLLEHEGHPVAVLQRSSAPQRGREQASLDVMGEDPEVVSSFIERVRRLMVELSVLRGQVLSFAPTQYGRDAGATFVERPSVEASDVVLAEGVLDEVVEHIVGIGEHRDVLRAAGQHLKRGVLLYGPPGTGKTLTVRHLLTRTSGTTVVLLTGPSIGFIGAAAELARTFQPSIVVMEDIDLVAMERHSSPQPLLFQVLDALDGLEGDADVAFVMTTNRVEVLEKALAERPGRVDRAVEIPLPSERERERLLRLYAARIALSEPAMRTAAVRTAGTTGSFAKELIRATVMRAAMEGHVPNDDDLAAALDDLMSARRALTRSMLGAPGQQSSEPQAGGHEGGGFASRH